MALNTVKIRVSSRIGWLDGIEQLAGDLAQLAGLGSSEVFDVSLSLREAVSNAIVHGNDGEPSRVVNLEFQLEEEALTITVRDEGKGFNVKDIPDPTQAENILKSHGRGVFYINNLMTEVDFSRTSQAGGEYKMTKRGKGGESSED